MAVAKPITEMSKEELIAEMEHLNSIPIPSAPTARAPKRTRGDVKPKPGRRASWRDALLEE